MLSECNRNWENSTREPERESYRHGATKLGESLRKIDTIEVAARNSKNTISVDQLHQFAEGITDAIKKHVRDPEVLREIAGTIEVVSRKRKWDSSPVFSDPR